MSSIRTALDLSDQEVKTLLILNVALTIPARIIVGTLIDRFGSRIVFTWLMITMAVPTVWFAFADSFDGTIHSRAAEVSHVDQTSTSMDRHVQTRGSIH